MMGWGISFFGWDEGDGSKTKARPGLLRTNVDQTWIETPQTNRLIPGGEAREWR
jgi:hypothetical protein